MDQQPDTRPCACPSRRAVVSAGAVGLASLAGLTACAGAGADPGATASDAALGPDPGAAGQGLAAGQAGSGQFGNPQLGANAEQSVHVVTLELNSVPKGGHTAVTAPDGKAVVVARTKGGKVVAFSATCTHQGCQVVPAGDRLRCPCHGAEFDSLNGQVLAGPAKEPLARVPVKVQGQAILLE